MKKGFFITLEGGEGSGKSTQLRLLINYLKKQGISNNLVATREPGGAKLAEAIRGLVLNPEYRIKPLAELLLYESNRAQHVSDVILPSLKMGKVVICDRFTDSTLAYQGYARGLDISMIKTLNRIASLGFAH